jgi:hypothetical protein
MSTVKVMETMLYMELSNKKMATSMIKPPTENVSVTCDPLHFPIPFPVLTLVDRLQIPQEKGPIRQTPPFL